MRLELNALLLDFFHVLESAAAQSWFQVEQSQSEPITERQLHLFV